MQVIMVYLEPFQHSSLLKYVSRAKNHKKITKTPYFRGLRSFKVINVNIHKKLVTSACYDR